MDEVVELQDMENVCRLCLSTDDPKSSVFGGQDSPVSLASKIQACLSIQILTTDKLSTQICEQCVRNVNEWHDYKEACLRSQDKLHEWFESHLRTSPTVVTIKNEPVDLDFCEDNIEVLSESTNDSDMESTNLVENINHLAISNQVQELTDDEIISEGDQPVLTKEMDMCVKAEPPEDYDTDCTIEIESVTGSELLLNPLSTQEDRIMEADSTQKSNASGSASKKKVRRGPHTHFRGARVFKQKCVHCQINLHSKYTYTKHMERFHSDKQNGDVNNLELQDDEEHVEDLEDELMTMEKDAPLTQVQQNIISQLKTFSCYSCQQSFVDRRSTLSHIRQHMPDLRPYTCIACLTEFPDRSMYKLHCGASFECAMKIALVIPKHGEEKYFTCNMCLRSMQNRQQLLSHLLKHSDKQYEELVSPSRSPPKLKAMTPLPPAKQEVTKKSLEPIRVIPRPYKNGDPAHNHVCDLCGMIYRYKPNMLKHRDLCQRLLPEVRTSYKCVLCGMTYLIFTKFQNHVTQSHKKKVYTCSECWGKFRSPNDYLEHHETHRNKTKSNDKNDSKSMQSISTPIRDWDTFEAEMNTVRLSDSKGYSCALCNLEFATRTELMEHRNLHLKVKIYSCVICRSMFSSAGALEIHMKDHGIEDPNERNANISCVEYGTVEDDSQDSNSMNASASSDPGSKKNECDLCGKMFSNSANLKRHIRNIHTFNRNHVCCPHCSQLFRTKETRDRHIALEHVNSSKAMLVCPKCPKSFFFQANLNLHFRTAHTEKLQAGHKCDICGKEFAEEASLKIHRSWHSRLNSRFNTQHLMNEDQKPMISPKKEVFNTNTGRPARARKSFPNPPPTKPTGNFQCQVCSDKFNDVTELREHLWDVHCARNKAEKNFSGNELQCELCTNVFSDRETLNIHLQWHKAHPILSDIRKSRFPCEICGKLYSSKKVLTRHKKLHKATAVAVTKFQSVVKNSGSSQALCSICHKLFSSNQALQRHKLNLHGNIFTQRPQSVYNSTRRMTQEEQHRPKRVKQELLEEQKPYAMDAMNAGKKSVMCHVCRKFFANMSVLYKHKQLMHNKSNLMKNHAKISMNECVPIPSTDGTYSCNICYKKFPGVPNLRQHFTVKHKNLPPKFTSMIFSCTLCDRHMFNRPAMSNHMLTAHNTVYDAHNSTNFHREMDLNSYTVEGAVGAVCPRCKVKYPNNKAMKIHYFKFHEGSDL
ncbi:PREDICTED: zinc finger protein 845-like [Habropoda laboriosa]|uniref:zinc finger protein 845-like n=1 Tax=Habropoda laboriosa TaxID=597456 RepID=UPI00083E1E3A|nr:PREDICTED: zinc finger protein 845-like [Habropoda laboriosa]